MHKPIFNPNQQAPFIYVVNSGKSWEKFVAFYKKVNENEGTELKNRIRGSVKKAAEGLLSNFIRAFDKYSTLIRYNWHITRSYIQSFNEGCYNNTYHLVDKLLASGFLVAKTVSVGPIKGKQTLALELTINKEIVHFDEQPNPFFAQSDVDNSGFLVYNPVEKFCITPQMEKKRSGMTTFKEAYSGIKAKGPL